MNRLLIGLSLTLMLVAAPVRAEEPQVASVEVVRDGRNWTADYKLEADAPVWIFARSDLPMGSPTSYRGQTVRVRTPGVSLKRIGNYDALVADNGAPVPRTVRLSFTPFAGVIESSYDPALNFSDGSTALFTLAFKLIPVDSLQAVASASIDSAGPTAIEMRDRHNPVLFQGKRTDAARLSDQSAYVLFGPLRPTIGDAMTTAIDPALPSWLADYLRTELPKVLATYAAELGPAPVGKPMLMVAWAGPTEDTSLSGAVLPGTVVMTIGGKGALSPSDKLSAYARWFVAHEAAHFWLGQQVTYAAPGENWIVEGGAELLAFRAIAKADPTFDIAKRLGESENECLPLLAKGGVAGAEERGDFRAHYACGVLFALVAEQSAGGDFPAFVRGLIANEGKDHRISRDEWLGSVERGLPDRGISARIGELLDRGSHEPKAAIDGLLAAAGVRQPILAEQKPAL